MGVGAGSIGVGQDPNQGSAGLRGAFAGRARNSPKSAVDDHDARFRQEPPHLTSRLELGGGRVGGATHGDISAWHRAKSLVVRRLVHSVTKFNARGAKEVRRKLG